MTDVQAVRIAIWGKEDMIRPGLDRQREINVQAYADPAMVQSGFAEVLKPAFWTFHRIEQPIGAVRLSDCGVLRPPYDK